MNWSFGNSAIVVTERVSLGGTTISRFGASHGFRELRQQPWLAPKRLPCRLRLG